MAGMGSSFYALVEQGYIVAKGSNAAMTKLAKAKGGRVWYTSWPVGSKVA